ncbi:hypothetical protein [Halobacteriovorax sp. CON-3]|uniref:hypothetical protein n=1 Tax=Halobacteriovorax sp. CON-3 TaxID=3157710 RepID=UPI0037110341
MRSIFLIPMILLLSCGKPNERAFFGQNLNPSFKGQSLTATQIQCQSIQTNFSGEEISCPTSFINEDKLFLFSIEDKSIDLKIYPDLGELEVAISINELIHANFYLVSKYGKRLSEDFFYDGSKTLRFQELNRGDFVAHEVYLKMRDYMTGQRPVEVAKEEDSNCSTGVFNIDDVNLSDLKGDCHQLRIVPQVKAQAITPEIETKEVNGRLLISRTSLPNLNQFKMKISKVGDFVEKEFGPSKFYLVNIDDYGIQYFLNNNQYCVVEGVVELYEYVLSNNPRKVNPSKYEGYYLKVGKRLIKNIRSKKCFPVVPKLTGYVVVKE